MPPDTRPIRERILEAAVAELRERGPAKLSQVRVARRARVRQSHVTYYFPTRHELVETVTARFVYGTAATITRRVHGLAGLPRATILARLAATIAEADHMRTFLRVIAEADADPAIRKAIQHATQKIEAALAQLLGGPHATARARVALATIWGLGLYEVAVRPDPSASPRRGWPSRAALATK